MRSLRLALAWLLSVLGIALAGAAPALADVARPPLEDPRNVALLVVLGLVVLAVIVVAVLFLRRIARTRAALVRAAESPGGADAQGDARAATAPGDAGAATAQDGAGGVSAGDGAGGADAPERPPADEPE